MVGIYFRSVTPMMGLMPGLKGFSQLPSWRYRQYTGGVLGGLYRIAEVMGALIFLRNADAVAFAILIIVLLFKPSGLIGSSLQEKV